MCYYIFRVGEYMKPIKKAIRTFSDMDKVLFFTSLILIIFGSLNIVTASSREAVVNADANMFYYFFKHIIILVISLVAFLIVLKIPTKDYKKWLPLIYIAVFGMNLFLILKGVATRGANNWIDLGFMKVQPSEFAKPTLILTMSLMFQMYFKRLKDVREKHDIIIWKIIGFGLIFPILVFLQKDLGTAIILFGIFAVLFVFSPISRSEKIKASLISIGILAILLVARLSITGYILSGAQTSRLNNFFDPCSKYEDTGYQVCNAFIAINNGGLTGVGLGKSTQKYSYIPEPHTDMVFAIIAEENGVLVCSLIFMAYLIIIYRILKLSMKTKRLSHRYICIGVATYFFLHILINLGGLFGIIPLTGVPLPFLSYGGSFTLSLIMTFAVIQRIHIEMKNEKIRV
ncbi:MAG: FtsW/RodA/SpoVE family cell cycle protein [Firmicutes bacterium]|nr:FtsW/RodA/SpoVE family cell cycle protein [Bacillota bacterium]